MHALLRAFRTPESAIARSLPSLSASLKRQLGLLLLPLWFHGKPGDKTFLPDRPAAAVQYQPGLCTLSTLNGQRTMSGFVEQPGPPGQQKTPESSSSSSSHSSSSSGHSAPQRDEFCIEFALPGGHLLVISEGDITQSAVDVIVNAANRKMLGGGGVDGAIHRAAGPVLLDACESLPIIRKPDTRLLTGDAVLLPSGRLPSKYVIGAVGPIYDMHEDPRRLLLCAHGRSLDIASSLDDVRSIAFPAISCGVYGYPPRLAAEHVLQYIIRTSRGKRDRVDLDEIHFVLFGESSFRLWCRTAEKLLQLDAANAQRNTVESGQGGRANRAAGKPKGGAARSRG